MDYVYSKIQINGFTNAEVSDDIRLYLSDKRNRKVFTIKTKELALTEKLSKFLDRKVDSFVCTLMMGKEIFCNLKALDKSLSSN